VPAFDRVSATRTHDHAANISGPSQGSQAEPVELSAPTDLPAHGARALAGLLRHFARPYTKLAWLVVFLLIAQCAGNLILPNLNGDIINNGILKGNVGYIWRTGRIMLGIVFVLGFASFAQVYWVSRVATGAGADMRAAIYRRVQTFRAGEISQFGIPTLVTRNINDVQQVQTFLASTTALVTASIMSVGAVILAVREQAELSLLLLISLPAMAALVGVTLAVVIPLFRSFQFKMDRISQVLRDQISGVRVIRAFRRRRSEQDRFRRANADITGTALRANRMIAVASPGLTLILNMSSVGVIWFGGHLINDGSMKLGTLTAFLTYLLLVLIYVQVAVTTLISAPRAVAGAERIIQVLNTVPAISDPPHPVVPATINGAVEFRHVTFGYPGSERPVLNDLTFTLPAGQTSAIIGGTGSGKTTLLTLIARYFDASGGSVLVNGTDVRRQSSQQLWSTMALVPQEAFLFRGTVASNLRFGRPEATDVQLWRTLDVAQAHAFVAHMPGHLDAEIDQGGSNVSGGQRQRLSIARALVMRRRLYLFDDCFSALDASTDARLRAALRAEIRDATVVIVAARVSTIMDADQIIVLEAGEVAGIGSHEQLLASCGPYQEIVASQLGQDAAV
jgi:ABC-type multidrug transport system fused ATPase/permease subunit